MKCFALINMINENLMISYKIVSYITCISLYAMLALTYVVKDVIDLPV